MASNSATPPISDLKTLASPPREKDPVCGMLVDPEKAARAVEHGGTKFHFCSTRCAERFSAEPEKFLTAPGTAGMPSSVGNRISEAAAGSGATASTAASTERIRYTCPMHPQ